MNDSTAAVRLKHFLDYVGMTNSQFADRCGIPRPTLSQLLSGRNKKLSDQVLKPIHDNFPALSLVWLMFGEGEMLISGSADVMSESPETSFIEDDSIPFESDDSDNLSQSIDSKSGTSSKSHASSAGSPATSEGKIPVKQDFSRGKVEVSVKAPRRVRSIVVYYDDNTYETFIPGGNGDSFL